MLKEDGQAVSENESWGDELEKELEGGEITVGGPS